LGELVDGRKRHHSSTNAQDELQPKQAYSCRSNQTVSAEQMQFALFVDIRRTAPN
jgi:hypothetical protein